MVDQLTEIHDLLYGPELVAVFRHQLSNAKRVVFDRLQCSQQLLFHVNDLRGEDTDSSNDEMSTLAG